MICRAGSLMSSGNAEDSGHTYDIPVAELRDGRTASIAINSPYRLEVETRMAIGLPETAAIKRKRDEEQCLHIVGAKYTADAETGH